MSATATRIPARVARRTSTLRPTRPADQTAASYAAAMAYLTRGSASPMGPTVRSAYEIAMVAR